MNVAPKGLTAALPPARNALRFGNSLNRNVNTRLEAKQVGVTDQVCGQDSDLGFRERTVLSSDFGWGKEERLVPKRRSARASFATAVQFIRLSRGDSSSCPASG